MPSFVFRLFSPTCIFVSIVPFAIFHLLCSLYSKIQSTACTNLIAFLPLCLSNCKEGICTSIIVVDLFNCLQAVIELPCFGLHNSYESIYFIEAAWFIKMLNPL